MLVPLTTPFETTVSMTIVQCASCSMPFGIPTHFQKKRQDDGLKFECPAGHPNYYKSEMDTLRKALEAEKGLRETAEKALVAEKKAHEASLRNAPVPKVTPITPPDPKELAKLTQSPVEAPKDAPTTPPEVAPPVVPANLLGATVAQKITEFLLANPTRVFHSKEIAKHLGIKPGTANTTCSVESRKKRIRAHGASCYQALVQ